MGGTTTVTISPNEVEATLSGLSIDASGHGYTYEVICKPVESGPKILRETLSPISVLSKEEPIMKKEFVAKFDLGGKSKVKKSKEAAVCTALLNGLACKSAGTYWYYKGCVVKGGKSISMVGYIEGTNTATNDALAKAQSKRKFEQCWKGMKSVKVSLKSFTEKGKEDKGKKGRSGEKTIEDFV